MDIEKANTETVERMMEARPVLIGLGKAIDVIPGMKENLLLPTHRGSCSLRLRVPTILPSLG